MKGKDNAITQDQLDAAIKLATDEATKRATALFQAREDVKPTVGAVALDSAEDVYAFGLKHLGVDTAGIHPSAFRQLFLVAAKGAKSEPKKDDASLALDAAGKGFNVSSIWSRKAA